MSNPETRIEVASCKELRRRGALDCVKVGVDGYPDRLILLGGNFHFWIEFKQPGGTLQPNQEVRIRDLHARGEMVFVCESVKEAVNAWETATAALCYVHLPGARRCSNA